MMPLITPNTTARGMGMVTPGTKDMSTQNTAEPTSPAKNPSQLFFGDVRGASLCLPNLLPTRYAKESLAHTLRNSSSTSTPPQGEASDPRITSTPHSSNPQ